MNLDLVIEQMIENIDKNYSISEIQLSQPNDQSNILLFKI